MRSGPKRSIFFTLPSVIFLVVSLLVAGSFMFLFNPLGLCSRDPFKQSLSWYIKGKEIYEIYKRSAWKRGSNHEKEMNSLPFLIEERQ